MLADCARAALKKKMRIAVRLYGSKESSLLGIYVRLVDRVGS